MNNRPNDETIKEILEEDQMEIENRSKKKSCLVRTLFFIIILFVLFFGFIYIQQYLLDLEANAIVSAARTATAFVNETSIKNDVTSDELSIETSDSMERATPIEMHTPEPAMVRTATIAAQLTGVAEFQKTVTPMP